MTGDSAAEPSWARRDRAEVFGAAAATYDAERPGYPDAFVARVVEGVPPRPPAGDGDVTVLDAATGTGILARQLRAHGADVTGVEFDPRMAEVARGHGFEVHVGAFEDLRLPRRFDRVTVGQAWHWIDPARGVDAARRLLAPGGQLALIWNQGRPTGPAADALTALYAPYGGAVGVQRGGEAGDAARATLGALDGVRVETLTTTWWHEYPTARYLAMVSTHSDHLTLPPAEREALSARLARAIDAHGGTVTLRYRTTAVIADGLAG